MSLPNPLPPRFPVDTELSVEGRELLARAREQLDAGGVPAPVRQRLFERALDEARRAEPSRGLPAAPLVRVERRGAARVLGGTLALALALVLLAKVRLPFRASEDAADPLAVAAERTPSAARYVEGRLFQSALFRAPAPEWSGALPPPSANLFGERPFSSQSRAWQVKRWDDLGAKPDVPAAYELEGGALCVALRPGERVIGGWPWPASAAPPAPVALSAGKAYRLVFKAWASEPLPSQLLIAVGHAELPFSAAGGARVEVSTTPEAFVVSFVARYDDPSVGVAFLANAAEDAAPSRVCLSDVTLTERPR